GGKVGEIGQPVGTHLTEEVDERRGSRTHERGGQPSTTHERFRHATPFGGAPSTWTGHRGLVRLPCCDPTDSSEDGGTRRRDRKSTRLNSSHVKISYAVFCLKKKKTSDIDYGRETKPQ